MTASPGTSAAQTFLVGGRGAIGLPIADNLAVDALADLAIDSSDSLEISPGVLWVGKTAAQTIET